MIKQPNELTFNDKKFSMILYGSPGLGKTTLALSAPDPVLIDFDRGVSRVKAYHRKTTIVCNTYDEVLADIKSPEVRDCQTIILDTGGSFVNFLKDWAMNAKGAKLKNGEFNSLKGFGYVKSEFASFTSHIRDVLNKNIIYIFHSNEEKDKDGNPIQRLQCEGAARNLVWQPCDLGAYMQMIGTRRILSFTPTDEFFAKGCYGIEGQREVPAIGPNDKNDYITRLFAEAKSNIAAEIDFLAPLQEQYGAVMTEVNNIINAITNVDEATEAAASIPKLEHALTSKKEASALLKAKTDSLGFAWDKEARTYKAQEVK